MSKEEYKKIDDEVNSYDNQMALLDVKELCGTKLMNFLNRKLVEMDKDSKKYDESSLGAVKRLALAAEELVERYKIEREKINKNVELPKSFDLNKYGRVSFLEGRDIRASIKDLEKISASGVKKTDKLEMRECSFGSVVDYIKEEVRILNSYISYCVEGRKFKNAVEMFDVLEKGIPGLLAVQESYEAKNGINNGKILVDAKNLKK